MVIVEEKMETGIVENKIDLTQKKCKPCEGGTLPLTPRDVRAFTTNLTVPWQVTGGNKQISRTFRFNDFASAMDFAVAIGKIAEEERHHPDLHVSYGKVIVELSTHAVGGLTQNDFILARKIELLKRPSEK